MWKKIFYVFVVLTLFLFSGPVGAVFAVIMLTLIEIMRNGRKS